MAEAICNAAREENREQSTRLALDVLLQGEHEATKCEIPRIAATERCSLALARVSILINVGRVSEAETLLNQHRTAALWNDGTYLKFLGLARQIYSKAGLPQDSIDELQQIVENRILIRRQIDLRLIRDLIDELLESKRTSEALSYAKLAYVVAGYNEAELQEVTDLLRRVWIAGGEEPQYTAFQNAQRDNSIANPLQVVELPKMPALTIVAELPRAQAFADKSRHNPGRFGELMTLQLASGQFGAAMQTAKQLREAKPNEPDGILAVARVFKAVDGGVVRARQYEASVRGEGQDPLPEFLEQNPPPADVALISNEQLAAMRLDVERRVLARRQFERGPLKLMVTQLLTRNQHEEALLYAKLVFILSPYQQDELQEAIQLLVQVWTAQGATRDISDFTKAQVDSTVLNPLQKVPLPKFPLTSTESALMAARTGLDKGGVTPRRIEELVTVLLAAERYGDAMEAALQWWKIDKGSVLAAMQIARVFKAADGDVAGASEFLAAVNNGGQTDELVRAFFTRFPARDKTRMEMGQ